MMADTQPPGCPVDNGATWSNGASTDGLESTEASGIPSPLQSEVYSPSHLFGPPEITSGLCSDTQVRSKSAPLPAQVLPEALHRRGLARIVPNLA